MNNYSPVRVGIAGATGYAGLELLRRLARHPYADVKFAMASRAIGIEACPRAGADLGFASRATRRRKAVGSNRCGLSRTARHARGGNRARPRRSWRTGLRPVGGLPSTRCRPAAALVSTYGVSDDARRLRADRTETARAGKRARDRVPRVLSNGSGARVAATGRGVAGRARHHHRREIWRFRRRQNADRANPLLRVPRQHLGVWGICAIGMPPKLSRSSERR